MTFALVLGLIAIVMMMAFNHSDQIPWVKQMRRVREGVSERGEWMAPQEVVRLVRQHYVEAINWLHDSTFDSWAQQWSDAPHHLSGTYLKRHQGVLLRFRDAKLPRIVGVLRCDHTVHVRHFNRHGEHCLVVDQQTGRRMATYNRDTHERLSTQDLGDGVVVYRMTYDARARRWKIESFVQELPAGWNSARRHIREFHSLPDSIGRDS
jgi:hypothetical protein